jgi:2-hydroxy-6-oxonona-2,4-dienedioate hydrolase
MPGWGESSLQSVETGRDPVEALLQLIDAMDIDKAAFVGNSMGGASSVYFTAQNPERVSHLVTMGLGNPAGVNILTPAGVSEGMRALIEAYAEPSPRTMKRLVQVMCFDQGFASDELVAERVAVAQEYPDHNENWLALLRAGPPMTIPKSTMETLAKSSVPAMFIHGRDDRTGHFEGSLQMVAVMPNSRMVLINRCGHWAQLEHAAEFNHLVDEFVSNN